jgi:hypothetical protein
MVRRSTFRATELNYFRFPLTQSSPARFLIRRLASRPLTHVGLTAVPNSGHVVSGVLTDGLAFECLAIVERAKRVSAEIARGDIPVSCSLPVQTMSAMGPKANEIG